MSLRFEDYHIQVEQAMKDKSVSFLEEVCGELRSQAQRNSRRGTSQTAGSFKYQVDEGSLTGYVGSDYWNAIYEEFGTGEHAINGDGRKGYWVFVESNGEPKAPKGGKQLTLGQAKRAMAMMRKKGLNAFYTNGKEANRPLFKAFSSSKSKIIKRAEEIFGGLSS